MSALDGTPWVDDDEHELRPYALTGGRTRPTNEMSLSSLLKARATAPEGYLSPEAAHCLALCRGEARSVAEVAATLGQPVQVAKILLSDLLDAGALIMAMPTRTADPKDPNLLEAVLEGLRTYVV
ncbi:DUF742 domain-containing protein [Streptomyces sp. NBC_01498]|uniref:DUF742 domain-containing protein n=1 Tax=Streptomyces sp. NBC_01498 TaxID=2975870 RepID=UPI002E7AFE2A|nr:DUF742 domain-containing protein [Streptomyces sp. NBC_01498]WTL26318.1 DUF742 domain-containing protein [Streptomyces sp. NBC_01498]